MTGVLTTRASQEHNIRRKKKTNKRKMDYLFENETFAYGSMLKSRHQRHVASTLQLWRKREKKGTTLQQHKYVEFDGPGERSPK